MPNHEWRFTQRKITHYLTLLKPLVYSQSHLLAPFEFTPTDHITALPDLENQNWQTIPHHSYWGANQINFLMRGQFQIPSEWNLSAPIALYLPLGKSTDFFNAHPEALIYVDGNAVAACDVRHQEVRLLEKDHAKHDLLLHGWTGLGDSLESDTQQKLYMAVPQLVIIHEDLRRFIALAQNALEVIEKLEDTNPSRDALLTALDQAFIMLDMREPLRENLYDSVPKALSVLQKNIQAAGHPLDVWIHAAGHAHIDLAWLWTWEQSKAKGARSFSTVLNLMKQFPNYHFSQSQPQLYDAIRQHYPQLFERIKERIVAQQWEPLGGMWVEADCNITGAESLARQFLLGRRFFAQHFGKDADSPILWLPDAFGFPWSLPQLIKQAGLDYFFTIKIGWNQYTEMPHDSFWWQGIDGTKVLAHRSSTPEPNVPEIRATYNAIASAGYALETWHQAKGRDTNRHILMSYGWGDGGGGPTREMLDNITAMQNMPAIPQLKTSRAIDFFKTLEQASGAELPVWNDELYLEYHQGTLTSVAVIKDLNHICETTLHIAEFLASYAWVLDPDYDYPTQKLTELWQILCLHQFHDILPGSSIEAVYVDAVEALEGVFEAISALEFEARAVLSQHLSGDYFLINPTSFTHAQHLELDGQLQPTVETVPPYSILSIDEEVRQSRTLAPFTPVIAEVNRLENEYLRLELNEQGDIIRLYDKRAKREILPEGMIANQLQLFEDRPTQFDAWNIDPTFTDKQQLRQFPSQISAESNGLMGTITIEGQIGASPYTQTIRLDTLSPRISFELSIDWQDQHQLLKVAFPVDILAPRARYGIQWGHIERPTHQNRASDYALYEVPAQGWADLSEEDYGVSLLSDGKYGFDVRENVMRLSLLRGSTFPNPNADQDPQTIAYALFPHQGGFGAATLQASNALIYDFYQQENYYLEKGKGERKGLPSLVTSPDENIIIETIKKAEDSEHLIIRFYEALRRRGEITLQFGVDLTEAWRVNLLEENGDAVTIQDKRTIMLNVTPFEIVSLKVGVTPSE